MNGRLSSVLFKVLAVVSALAIGGGYVVYKEAGAKKAKQLKRAELAKDREEKKRLNELLLIVGSKSISQPIFTKEAGDFVNPINGNGKAKGKVLLPSSKIGIIVMPEIIPEEEEPAGEKPMKLLPGSKNPNFILDNPELKKSE